MSGTVTSDGEFMQQPGGRGVPPLTRGAMFAVHVLTASGAALGFLALAAAAEHNWSLMFLWLGVALIVDAVDGPIARRIRVAQRLPRWSGETLDLIVDFVTYVLVPAFAIAVSGVLPSMLSLPAGLVIVVTSALYFGDRKMKLPDNYFRGFPAVWNLVAFYLLLLRPPSWVGVVAVVGLAIATFLPMPFVHPVRVARLRGLTLALVALWGGLAIAAVARDMAPGPWITIPLTAIGLYILGAGLLRRPAAAEPDHP
jgi:phosphatidylcholine synthase